MAFFYSLNKHCEKQHSQSHLNLLLQSHARLAMQTAMKLQNVTEYGKINYKIM